MEFPLIFYNVMFIIMLAIMFLAMFFVGVKTPELHKLGRRSVVPGKVALGLLFAVMAGMLMWL